MRLSAGLGLAVALLVAAGCGGAQKASPAPVVPVVAKPKPPPPPPKPVFKFEGPRVKLGHEFEIRGYGAVAIEGEQFAIYLKKTKWTEMTMGDKVFREGYAEIECQCPDGSRAFRVDMDDTDRWHGFDIKVLWVGSILNETTYRESPHARFVVTRASGP